MRNDNNSKYLIAVRHGKTDMIDGIFQLVPWEAQRIWEKVLKLVNDLLLPDRTSITILCTKAVRALQTAYCIHQAISTLQIDDKDESGICWQDRWRFSIDVSTELPMSWEWSFKDAAQEIAESAIKRFYTNRLVIAILHQDDSRGPIGRILPSVDALNFSQWLGPLANYGGTCTYVFEEETRELVEFPVIHRVES